MYSVSELNNFWERNTQGVRGIVIYAILGVIAAVLLNAILGGALGTSLPIVTVSSTSMEPTLSVGDLVIVTSENRYEPGEIIVFRSWEQRPIIHRVVVRYDDKGIHRLDGWEGLSDEEIREMAGDRDTIYITKGDANTPCDQCGPGKPAVTPDQIAGRTVLSIPFLGYVKLAALDYIWTPLTGT